MVRAQCPACGAKLRVDSRKDIAECDYCGQRSALRTKAAGASGPAAPIAPMGPATTGGSAPMPVIVLPNIRRRIILIVVLTLLPLLLISTIVFFVIRHVRNTVEEAFGGARAGASFVNLGGGASEDDEPTLPVVSDYLANPTDIPQRVRQGVANPPEVRRVQITRQTVEVYPASGERYSIHANGKALRRGGAVSVPAQTFDLATIDFTILPVILDKASKRSGGAASIAVLEADQGTPRWKISPQMGGADKVMVFAISGEYVEDP